VYSIIYNIDRAL